MICPECKSSIFDNSRFCPMCGKKFIKDQEKPIVRAPERPTVTKYCPLCSKKYDGDKMYCSECGGKLRLRNGSLTPAPQPQPPVPVQTQPAVPMQPPVQTPTTHRHIFKSEMINYYEGEPTVGAAKFSGYVDIYDDCIEFEAKLGNSAASMFGPLGMALAANGAKKDETVIPLSNIKALKSTKYMGVMKMLTVELKNGSKFSLTSFLCISRPIDELADMLSGATNIEIR